MPSEIEVQIRTQNTYEFMHAESITVVFNRRTLVDDGAGGFKRGPAVDLESQELRLVTSNTQLPIRRTVDGREVQPVLTLVAMPDLDVQNGDIFTHQAVRYEVLFVYPARIDATRADVGYGR